MDAVDKSFGFQGHDDRALTYLKGAGSGPKSLMTEAKEAKYRVILVV